MHRNNPAVRKDVSLLYIVSHDMRLIIVLLFSTHAVGFSKSENDTIQGHVKVRATNFQALCKLHCAQLIVTPTRLGLI